MTTELHPTDGPIHAWFGLSYSNYQVIPRTFMQSMPIEWQERMVTCLEELRDAFEHQPQPEVYEVHAATEHIVNEMTDSQLYAAGIEVENDDPDGFPGPETRWHRPSDGSEVDGHERVLLRCADPVPHYNRGRTYLEPCPDHAPRPPMTDAERADHDASMTRLQAALRPKPATRH